MKEYTIQCKIKGAWHTLIEKGDDMETALKTALAKLIKKYGEKDVGSICINAPTPPLSIN